MGQDATWRPAGPPREGENPGQDPQVQRVVNMIKMSNATRRAERRTKR